MLEALNAEGGAKRGPKKGEQKAEYQGHPIPKQGLAVGGEFLRIYYMGPLERKSAGEVRHLYF